MAKEIIKTEDVMQVATLSRLEFNDVEIENFKKDLSDIVDYFSILTSVQTDGVLDVNKPEGAPRVDEPRESLSSSEIVRNAPHKNHNAFIVPRVVE